MSDIVLLAELIWTAVYISMQCIFVLKSFFYLMFLEIPYALLTYIYKLCSFYISYQKDDEINFEFISIKYHNIGESIHGITIRANERRKIYL